MLAIILIVGHRRLPEDICEAAPSAAREAFQRRKENSVGDWADFGIGLHMGATVYGNVGIKSGRDFAVAGTSAAMASRIEGLTHSIASPLPASGDFAKPVSERSRSLGAQSMRGFGQVVEDYLFDHFLVDARLA